jgi:glycosyltransferase involved in cell wall biosynthesis
MSRVSIVIRCYNEEQHIGRLLSGIMRQTMKDVEIILVDSGSTDATLSVASRYPVRVLSISPEEFSFGRSLNMGCTAATGEFIIVASAHVYPVYRDWLAKLLAPFTSPKVALVYGKQRGEQTTQYAEHRIFAQWYPEETNLCQKHPFCNNANAAIRRELWEKVPYDEELTGLEDLDWANRMMDQGYCLAYVAEAEVVHVHDETPAQTYNRYRREGMAFKRIFPRERFGLGDCARIWAANVWNDYKHSWRDGVLRHEWLGIPRFRLMQFWGTYVGYRQHRPVSQQLRRTFYYPNHRGRMAGERGRDEAELRILYDRAWGSQVDPGETQKMPTGTDLGQRGADIP